MQYPERHRALVEELLAQHGGDHEALRANLIEFALDTCAAARDLGSRAPVSSSDEDADLIPTARELVADAAASCGLVVRDFIHGRPTTALIAATDRPVVIGEEDDTSVLITKDDARAKVTALAARGRTGSALFSVSVRELRVRTRFAPEGYALVIFVLRSESRVWVMTRGEVFEVYEALQTGTKLKRFSLGREGLLRVSMPRKPTGLDFAFPRVSFAPEDPA